MKPFRIEFNFTEQGYIMLVAENEEVARDGALKLLKKRVKDPVITAIVDADDDQLELPFGEPSSSIN